MKPWIGIPCETVRDKEWWPVAHGHRQTYIEAVVSMGALPLLIPTIDQDEVLLSYYNQIDGLLLAGGKDISPAHYGEHPHPNLDEGDPVQDCVEISLARRALAEGMPILAICRGMQLLNVAMGGTLYQDLPAQCAASCAVDHDASSKHAIAINLEDWTFRAHDIQLDAESQLAYLLETRTLRVNSLHHQAIKRLAPGLRAAGWSPDGVVEAVEGGDNTSSDFLIGVQCHPEALYNGADTRWQTLFSTFVESCITFHWKRDRHDATDLET